KTWSEKKNIKCKEDKVGNILLFKEASNGCEKYPLLTLQAHMDMVCQKEPSVDIDFEEDPIPVKVQENIVTAKGTTLGADNGIGVAMGLAALASKKLQHGPLEVLLTVDEETGLTGAFALEKGFFKGNYLLNLDSEEEGKITISSAGGGGTQYKFPITKHTFQEYISGELVISGLQGGHSGTDIDKGRINAIKLLVEGLKVFEKNNVSIIKIEGGSAHNAIPRDCICQILYPKEKEKQIEKAITIWKQKTLKKTKKNEKNISIEFSKLNKKKGISLDETTRLIKLLDTIPHGPQAFSQEIEGLVETSNNLAIVQTKDNIIAISVSTRSSDDEKLEKMRNKLKTIGKQYGAIVEQGNAYPGWKPQPDSPFLKLVKKSYEKVLEEEEVELLAIHAGLECGLFLSINPELQLGSIGPNIYNAHSPDEYVEIASVQKIWKVVKEIIKNMDKLSKN
ncbi:MAG: beta-Ala-His dipeptidase, partial [Asgard group archaeon]|nr:beta-Ala-His dipeptidase [Asgard group archaeon]